MRCANVHGTEYRVAELVRARGPLFATTQIVEIKTFTLRERYEVLLLRTSCYAARRAHHSKLCSESFFICHFPLSASWKHELSMCVWYDSCFNNYLQPPYQVGESDTSLHLGWDCKYDSFFSYFKLYKHKVGIKIYKQIEIFLNS